MKLILNKSPDKELTVSVEYSEETKQVKRIMKLLQAENKELIGYRDEKIIRLSAAEIYYVECVDKRAFLYTQDQVYESKSSLGMLEGELQAFRFVRVSKSCLMNINQLSKLRTLPNSKIEGILSNGERIIVSRTYIKNIRKEVFQEKA